LHLPACRSLGAGRALFEQPGEDDFSDSLLLFVMILTPRKLSGTALKFYLRIWIESIINFVFLKIDV
jgi:hypothetical protein